MLNENRIKVMTKMAMYETSQGTEDMKINSYYKKDYVGFKTLISIIWMTLAYVLAVVLWGGLFLDEILKDISVNYLIFCAVIVVGLYLVLLLAYVIGASEFYKVKYTEARARLKKFNHNLTRLSKMYEKEKR